MNTGTKATLIIVGLIGLGIGVYFLTKTKKSKKQNGEGEPEDNINETTTTTTTTTPTDTPTSTSARYTDQSFPLKLYSGGQRVSALQRYLNVNKGENLTIDGKFGPNTLAAVKRWINKDQVDQFKYFLYVKSCESSETCGSDIPILSNNSLDFDLGGNMPGQPGYTGNYYHEPSTLYVHTNTPNLNLPQY